MSYFKFENYHTLLDKESSFQMLEHIVAWEKTMPISEKEYDIFNGMLLRDHSDYIVDERNRVYTLHKEELKFSTFYALLPIKEKYNERVLKGQEIVI